MPKPADPWRDTLYDVPTLNRLFLASSLLLLLVTLWMAWQDYDRNWKGYQRRFEGLALKRAETDAAKALQDLEALPEWKALQEELAAAKAEAAAGEVRAAELRKEREGLRGALEKAGQEYQFAKSEVDALKYRAQAAAAAHAAARERGAAERTLAGLEQAARGAREEFDRRSAEEATLKAAWEDLQGRDRALAADLAKIGERAAEVAARKAKLEFELATRRRQVVALEPDWRKSLLSAPVFDFMAPPIRINQILLPHFQEDVNFATVFRVDRCTTCHLAIDRPGWTGDEVAGTPFRSHPNLDLFVGEASPHPMATFGCTICHGGQGRSVDFSHAAHFPRDAAQEERWRRDYSWHPVEHFDDPMLPVQYAWASCTKCHASQHRVEGAEPLNEGKRLVERLGCAGCHGVAGMEDLEKTGPSLAGVKHKLARDWAWNWMADPAAFRPHTRMPAMFGLSPALNAKEREEVKGKYEAEMHGIVEYLWTRSSLPGVADGGYPAPPAGDAARGKKVANAVGCTGCHVLEGYEDPGNEYRSFGPNLSAVGSKADPGWLYAWLRNPKQYSERTAMPVVTMTDQEAADVTAWLMTLRHPSRFEERRAPALDERVLDAAVLDFMKAQMPVADAEKRIAGMARTEKLVWLGEKAIGQMGCYGCHTIPGFETAKKPGAELTGTNATGTKDITKFDFGFRRDLKRGHAPLSNDRIGWIRAKLEDPRTFDGGRIVPFADRLRMPKYALTDREISNVTTYLLSLRRDVVNPQWVRTLAHEERVVDRGKRALEQANCAGCHKIGLWPSTVAIADAEEAPGEVWQQRVFAARNVLPDGRQVDRLTPSDEAALRRRGAEVLLRKGDWLTPSAVVRLYEAGVTSVLVYGRGEGGIRELVNLTDADNKAPPYLVAEGDRVNPDWLFRFLKQPSEIRPWLAADQQFGVRMPVYGFDDAKTRLIVEHFALVAGVPYPFSSEEKVPLAKLPEVIAKGKLVFEANQCGKCHLVRGLTVSTDTPAPRFAITGARIRRDFFERWMRDPQRYMPGTGMTQYNETQVRPEDVTPLWEFIKSLAEPE